MWYFSQGEWGFEMIFNPQWGESAGEIFSPADNSDGMNPRSQVAQYHQLP